MKPLIFLGQTFAEDGDFRRAFPAYAHYVPLVRAGADTPHKIEVDLHRRASKAKRGRKMPYSIRRKRA